MATVIGYQEPRAVNGWNFQWRLLESGERYPDKQKGTKQVSKESKGAEQSNRQESEMPQLNRSYKTLWTSSSPPPPTPP